MTFKVSIAIVGAVLTVAGTVKAAEVAPLSTPMGITFQPIGEYQGYGPQRRIPVPRPYPEVVFANEKGLTLYTFDEDVAGKSNCDGECATTWLPAIPIASAKEIPGWKIIGRSDGRKQWAHDDKPLYTFKDDKEGGEVLGLGADPEADGRSGVRGHAGKALKAKLPKGWKIHLATTGGRATLGGAPFGFVIKDVTDAPGFVIVDTRGQVVEKVVYLFSGDLTKDKRECRDVLAECPEFTPVQAPEIARTSLTDWSIINRNDGIRQWAYKGLALYTFDGDRVTGDVHGKAIDRRWQLAFIRRNFMPTNVSYRDDRRKGQFLTTSKGMTLYRRDLNAFHPGSNRVSHDRPYRTRVGRMIRDVSCDAQCAKSWKPHIAPSGAQPNGYWGVSVLDDGRKQWTYKDYALFTFVGDEAPGDTNGDLTYDTTFGDDPSVDNNHGFPALYKPGFNWGIASF